MPHAVTLVCQNTQDSYFPCKYHTMHLGFFSQSWCWESYFQRSRPFSPVVRVGGQYRHPPKHSLCVGWWNLFSSCAVVFLAGNRFWFNILHLEYHTVVALCKFFCSGGKQFLVLRTYLEYNTVVRLCHFFCCGGIVNFVRIFTSNNKQSTSERKTLI